MPNIHKSVDPPNLASVGRIPPIIHQTFKSLEVTHRMHAAVRSWIDLNPGFAYRFYDDDDQRRIIAEHFDGDVAAAHAQLQVGAFRADFWRYCQLYIDGGVYADIDTVCHRGLDGLIKPNDDFVVPRATATPSALFNGFFCARPGHPFLKAAIERATVRILKADMTRFDGYNITGPGCLGQAVNAVLGREEGAHQELGVHTATVDGETLQIRILDKRPATQDLPRHVTEGEAVYLFTKYDGYIEDIAELGVTSWTESKTWLESRKTKLEPAPERYSALLANALRRIRSALR